MAQRANFYAHDEYEEDLGDVNIEAVVGNYGQGGHGMYEDGAPTSELDTIVDLTINGNIVDQARIDEATMAAMQHQMAQQVAFAQIPDVVKRVSRSFDVSACPLIEFRPVYCAIPPSCAG